MARMTITQWVHRQLLEYVNRSKLCVDATAGKGHDTLFLCSNMPQAGKLLAFDIQREAVESTRELLQANGFGDHASNAPDVQVILEGHEHMDNYLQEGTVDVMMFNLGYLPGGDHTLATGPDTTLPAIGKGLKLLSYGGIMSVCIYSGGDSGFAERDAVLSYLRELDAKEYTVIVSDFYNKPNHPPIPVFILK